MNKNNINTVLDGSLEEGLKNAEASLAKLMSEEIERAMSDEFAYLDED